MKKSICTAASAGLFGKWQRTAAASRSLATAVGIIVAAAGNAHANSNRIDLLKRMSLDDLINVEVTIANKTPRKMADVAAAVFVITGEDIRRSGVSSIPQALRMVPGLQVGRIDNRNWAVGIRGFNGRFSNKLLVQIDGRSLYTPQFSGVYWDAQDLVMTDIERIEVIRGPGATLWGANAVNGIINIITRTAYETPDTMLGAGAGQNNVRHLTLRDGGRMGADGAYRVYLKATVQDSPFATAQPAVGDDYQRRQAGFRMDWNHSDRDQMVLQGTRYDHSISDSAKTYSLSPPFVTDQPQVTPFEGANVLYRWTRDTSAGGQNTLQAYADWSMRTGGTFAGFDHALPRAEELLLDLDWQQSRPLGADNLLVWGAGYRQSRTEATFIRNGKRTDHLFSAFVQDEMRFYDDRLTVTAGSKVEHNQYSGYEVQPSARALWKFANGSSLWTAISRAVRTPARLEHEISAVLTVLEPFSEINPSPLPLVLPVQGDTRFGSESALSGEIGFRTMLGQSIAVDIAAFYTEYSHLRTLERQAPAPNLHPPQPHLVVPSIPANQLSGSARGLEIAADWQAADWWRIKMAYSWLNLDLQPNPESSDRNQQQAEGQSPEHSLVVRSSMDLEADISLDVSLRYVDELASLSTGVESAGTTVPSYTTLDLRLAWQARDNLELSLAAEDLLGAHAEFDTELFGSQPLAIGARYSARLDWRF